MTVNEILENMDLENEINAIRRTLHQNPCVSEHEEETVKFLASKLDELGIAYEIILDGCSIVATLEGGKPGPVVGVRGDIDALPIKEETGLRFASKKEGIMHACGHDAHATILLGTAKVLASMKEELSGTVKFFFQPAEESIGGAQRMIAAGCLENPHVDYVVGLHVSPLFKAGEIGVKYGKGYAASDMIDIRIRGKSSHGAHPDKGVDAIIVAANILNTIQTVVSRRVAPEESAVCSFGKIVGGTVRNQIADTVTLNGIIRTLDPKQRVFVREQVQKIAESVASAMGGEAEFILMESYGPLMNNDAVVEVVEKNAIQLLGKENVIREKNPNLGTEDFSYFALERPACFFHLGCYNEKMGERVDLHNCRFNIDESCLKIGVAMQVKNVLSLLNGEAKE